MLVGGAQTSARGTTPALLWRAPSLAGTAGAGLAFAASLIPSLLPRAWYLQGAVSGVLAAFGYALGCAGAAPVWRLRRRRAPVVGRSAASTVVLCVVLVLAVVAIGANQLWQADVRGLMSMQAWIAHYPLSIPAVALSTLALFVLVGRLVAGLYRAYAQAVHRTLPQGWASALQFPTALVVVFLFADVVVGGRIVTAVNASFAAADAASDTGVQRPESSYRSGGPGTLIGWETLGRQGRTFVSQGPRATHIEAFSGQPAREPIRVYAGQASADTFRGRADLAVAELERTGAFERKVLVVVVPTGTGWVDPYAMEPLEYMYDGDTAAVATQYSYVPSWIQMLGDQDRAIRAGRTLFDAVSERLERMPATSRPKLLVYGESLGVFGAESIFDGVDDIRARTDGVLWVGPPRANRLWHEITTNRDPGSPVWKPVYQGGEAVRFGFDEESFTKPERPWEAPRVGYLQHASDPVTWWSPELLFQRPQWLDAPRAPDISAKVPFIPVATFVQVTIDLAISTTVSPGHGHKFGLAQADAWTLILPPAGWSDGDTRRLRATITPYD